VLGIETLSAESPVWSRPSTSVLAPSLTAIDELAVPKSKPIDFITIEFCIYRLKSLGASLSKRRVIEDKPNA
jgi:hypothetical protein